MRSRAGAEQPCPRRDAAGSRRLRLAVEPLGVILTGGRATRLRPLSEGTPKSLIPLLNRPLIAYAIEQLVEAGVREIVIVLTPSDDRTEAAVRAMAPSGARISFAVQAEPRGSGDALTSAGDVLDGRHVVVAASDTIMRGSLRAQVQAFVRSGYDAWLVLSETDRPQAMGIAVLEGDRVVHLEEKPEHPRSNLALTAIWMLGPRVIDRFRRAPEVSKRGEVEITGSLESALRDGLSIGGALFEGEWLDCGTLASLVETQGRLLDGPALIHPSATVEDCALGPNVVVGEDAVLRRCRLSHALVAPGARLEGVEASHVVVLGDGQVASA